MRGYGLSLGRYLPGDYGVPGMVIRVGLVLYDTALVGKRGCASRGGCMVVYWLALWRRWIWSCLKYVGFVTVQQGLHQHFFNLHIKARTTARPTVLSTNYNLMTISLSVWTRLKDVPIRL